MTYKLYLNKELVYVYGSELSSTEAFIILHCVFFPIVQTLASEVYEGRPQIVHILTRGQCLVHIIDLHIRGDKENDKLAEDQQNKL